MNFSSTFEHGPRNNIHRLDNGQHLITVAVISFQNGNVEIELREKNDHFNGRDAGRNEMFTNSLHSETNKNVFFI